MRRQRDGEVWSRHSAGGSGGKGTTFSANLSTNRKFRFSKNLGASNSSNISQRKIWNDCLNMLRSSDFQDGTSSSNTYRRTRTRSSSFGNKKENKLEHYTIRGNESFDNNDNVANNLEKLSSGAEAIEIPCSNGSRSESNIEKVLSHLNAIQFPNSSIPPRDCGMMVTLLCKAIQYRKQDQENKESAQSAAIFRFISKLSQKRQLEFSREQLDIVLPHLLRLTPTIPPDNCNTCSENQKQVESTSEDSARWTALSFVLYDNADRCSSFQDKLFDILLKNINHHVSLQTESSCLENSKAVASMFLCIANFMQKCPDKFIKRRYVEKTFDCAEAQVYKVDNRECCVSERVIKNKALATCLRVLRNCILLLMGKELSTNKNGTENSKQQHFSAALEHRITNLVNRLRLLTVFGIPETGSAVQNSVIMQQGSPSRYWRPRSAPASPSWTNGVTGLARLSESEFSDSDNSYAGNNKRSTRLWSSEVKIRTNALELLQTLCRVAARTMNGIWDRLIPQKECSRQSSLKNPTLLSPLLYDTHPTVRGGAACAILSLLENSPVRKWLGSNISAKVRLNKNKNNTRGFVPQSVKIEFMIKQLHMGLKMALVNASDYMVIAQILQCLIALMKITPYQSLADFDYSWLGPFQANLEVQLSLKDKDVVEVAGNCIITMLESEIPKGDIEPWLRGSLLKELVLGASSTTVSFTKKNTFISLLGKSFEVFGTSLGHDAWTQLYSIMIDGFSDPHEEARKAALNMLEVVIKSERSELEHWQAVVSRHLPLALGDTSSSVRIAAAMCVSHLHEKDWAVVPQDRRSFCIASIVSAIDDDLPAVSTAALRVAGSMALLDSFKTSDFVDNILPVLIMAIGKEHTLIRQRAATALANVAYARSKTVLETLQHLFLHRNSVVDNLVHTLIFHCDDQDKIAAPSIRALGHVFVLLHQVEALQQIVIDTVAKKANKGNAKLRWSSCNAIAYMVKYCPENIRLFASDTVILHSLKEAVKACDNFKVRLSAVSALTAPESVEGYGGKDLAMGVFHFFDCFLTEFSRNENPTNLVQYQSSLSFRYAVLVAISKLIIMLIPECSGKIVFQDKDAILTYMKDACTTIGQEKGITESDIKLLQEAQGLIDSLDKQPNAIC